MAEKNILVEHRIKRIVSMPEEWNKESIDFYYDGSSHCMSNDLQEIIDAEEVSMLFGCCNGCDRTSTEVLSMTPTEEEIERYRPETQFRDAPITPAEKATLIKYWNERIELAQEKLKELQGES